MKLYLCELKTVLFVADSGAVKETLHGGGESASAHAGGRRRSSGDFDFYSPGDLLSHVQRDLTETAAGKRRPVPPLLKRNTIADFANTRAYQESTASLISATDQGLYSYAEAALPFQLRTECISY